MGFVTRQLTGRVVDEAADRLAEHTERAIDEVIRLRSAAIARDVDEQRAGSAEKDEDFARALMYKRCAVSAAGGAVSSLPAVVPGVGTVVGLATALTDSAAQTYAQVTMILAIARAYGHDLEQLEARRGDVLAVLAIEADVISLRPDGSLKAKGKDVDPNALGADVNRSLANQVIKRVAQRRVRTLLGKELPFGIGVAVGAGSNFRTMRRVGRTAMKYYRTRAKP